MSKQVIKLLFVVMFVTIGLLGISSFDARAEKIGYVDVAKVFDKYEKTKKFDKELAEVGKQKQSGRDTIVLEVRRLKDEMALLSDQGKEQKQKLVDQKMRELQDYDRDAQRDLLERREGVMREIFKDIDEVIRDYGKQKGFDFIFNERLMLFRSEKYDVTDVVLGELNARYKKTGK
ncbi:MAG: OmpH family outer membrane protein [Candidatus Omnitrophica bacterium]|nr:OmpH family outer membrane protein [Candidatus Omnitrophota bacterium]